MVGLLIRAFGLKRALWFQAKPEFGVAEGLHRFTIGMQRFRGGTCWPRGPGSWQGASADYRESRHRKRLPTRAGRKASVLFQAAPRTQQGAGPTAIKPAWFGEQASFQRRLSFFVRPHESPYAPNRPANLRSRSVLRFSRMSCDCSWDRCLQHSGYAQPVVYPSPHEHPTV